MFIYIKNFLEIAESISVILGVVFLVIQIRQQTKIARADHDRKKKQSTIDYYEHISSESKEFYNKIKGKKLNLENIKNNKELEEDVSLYLSHLERLAIGVASKIYDIDILNHMSGKFLTKKYYQLKDYIEDSRKKGNHYRYCEFEKMIKEIEKNNNDLPVIKIV